MTENPYATQEPHGEPQGRSHIDRSGWLKAFGVLEILLGGVCALLVPLSVVGQVLSARVVGAEVSLRQVIPSALIYGAGAVALIWIGIGSIRARRWARSLMLIVSWYWLLTGVVMVLGTAFLVPASLSAVAPTDTEMSEAFLSIVMTVTITIEALFFVVLPAIVIAFYSSEGARATVEALDPKPAWTDACPTEVLVMSFWTFVGGLSVLLVPISYNGAMPFFGAIFSGWTGSLLAILLGIVWIYAGWKMYRLEPIGWWVALVATIVSFVSPAVTFRSISLADYYRAAGFPSDQIRMMEQTFSTMSGTVVNGLLAAAVLFFLLFLGYLLYLKKYFRQPA